MPPVIGNELRLGQVFLNLLQNAVQALGAGDPARYEIGVRAQLEPPERVRVEVWDTGAGIEWDEMQRRLRARVAGEDAPRPAAKPGRG